MGAINRKDFRK